jgi:hypothetical protein
MVKVSMDMENILHDMVKVYVDMVNMHTHTHNVSAMLTVNTVMCVCSLLLNTN